MIKRADASSIKRERATKEQIAENFKRLATDNTKKVELKPSILKTVKTLDGKTFGIIHENKTYYLKYTTKNGSTNPVDFKHLDGLNSTFGIEKHNSFEKAINKMNFICEAQNNAHKLRLLNEAEENIMDDSEEEDTTEKVTSDSTEDTLLKNLDKEKSSAADMSGEMSSEPAADMGAAPVDTTQTGVETPKQMADDILGPEGIGSDEPSADATAPAPEGGEEAPAAEPAADMGGEEAPDTKKEFQEKIGEIGQLINDLQDKDQFDEKDIKNVMNSVISAVGKEGFKEVGDKVVDSFVKKMKGSEEKIDTPSEPEAESAPIEEPAAEEQLDENFLRQLKAESKRLLKEQLQQEIIKRKRSILIEGIKRKLI